MNCCTRKTLCPAAYDGLFNGGGTPCLTAKCPQRVKRGHRAALTATPAHAERLRVLSPTITATLDKLVTATVLTLNSPKTGGKTL